MWTWRWLFVLEAVVIVTGNVLVLATFTRTSSLRKRKYVLIVNQSFADLLVGLTLVPMYVIQPFVIGFTEFNTVYTVQDVLFGTASIFGLAAVAIERAYATYFPFKHRTLWKGAYMIGIAAIWVLALLAALPQLFIKWPPLLYTEVAAVVISLCVISTSYTLIWKKMRRLPDHAIYGLDKKLTVTFLIITAFSMIGWIPFEVINVTPSLCSPGCRRILMKYFDTLIPIAKFLQYGNSIVNPLVYTLRMPQFKAALLQRLRCGPSGCLPFDVEMPTAQAEPPGRQRNDKESEINIQSGTNTGSCINIDSIVCTGSDVNTGSVISRLEMKLQEYS